MKDKAVRFIALSFCLLFGMLVVVFLVKTGGAASAERTVGVKEGDWIKYGDFQALWGSDDPEAEPWQGLIDVNQTEWVKNEVIAISGTNITFRSVTQFKDGTSVPFISSVDVRTGLGIGNFTFVSAGLAPGDSLYDSFEFLGDRINETIPSTYAGLTRQTNHINATFVDASEYVVMVSNNYWDKATGILVERRVSFLHKDGGYITWATLWDKMIDNNIWIGVPDTTRPIADAGDDQTVETGASVTFDAGGSVDDVGIARFEWDFGDGEGGTGLKVTYTYTEAGTYNVTLTVVDAKGNDDTDSLTVIVRESSPPLQLHPAVAAFTILALILLLWFLLKRRSKSSRSRSRARVKRLYEGLVFFAVC